MHLFCAHCKELGEVQKNKENKNHPMIPSLFTTGLALPSVNSTLYHMYFLLKTPQFLVAFICVCV